MKYIIDNGVNLIVDDKVTNFEKDTVFLSSDTKIKANAIVMAIGVTPEIQLAKNVGLEIGETGAIKIDSKYKTSMLCSTIWYC